MGKEKKKGQSGEATTYFTRTRAMRKLQVSMPEFRRLCILKGIYPQEPKHKRKVNKGSSVYKTYYFRKDIQWLAHEPLLKKSQDFKIFLKKLKRALEKDDQVKMASVEEQRPRYNLDHIVRERYPSFQDALRDVDDALSMVFLYSSMASKKVKSVIIHNCRRIAVEFIHYIIASRALKKVFLSIKGIYYQVEVEGQTITWLTPYSFPQRIPRDVDFRVMSTFVEFYLTLLGFINYKLYQMLNLRYPPQISGLSISPDSQLTPTLLVDPRDLEWDHSEHRQMLESLSQSLASVLTTQPTTLDAVEIDDDMPVDLDPQEQALRDSARKEQEELQLFKKLFEGCCFFISRETPRESLTFVIRCFGGEVSWDPNDCVGSTYSESDETITHQIVDRPEQKHRNYAPGCVLPPHLSPFVVEKEGDYVTPDKAAILEAFGEGESKTEHVDTTTECSIDNATSYFEEILRSTENDEDDITIEQQQHDDKKESTDPIKSSSKKRKIDFVQVVGNVIAGDECEEEEHLVTDKSTREEKKLAIMMLTGKRRKLYDRIMKSKNHKNKRIKQLHEKRRQYETSGKN